MVDPDDHKPPPVVESGFFTSAPVDEEAPLDDDKTNPDMGFLDQSMDALASVNVTDVGNRAVGLPGQMFGSVYGGVAVGAGYAAESTMMIAYASSDKTKIAKYLNQLEDERKAVMGVMANVEAAEGQRKVLPSMISSDLT